MARLTQRDQYRLVEIYTEPSHSWTDVTPGIREEGVVFEDVAFGISSLRFTLTDATARYILNLIYRGMKVRFKGGYLLGRREWLFEGNVTEWTPIFPTSGVFKLEITALDPLFVLTTHKPGIVTYPCKPGKRKIYARKFQEVRRIKLSEIVKGILNEFGFTLGSFEIPAHRDITFNRLYPITQNEFETDYDFILRLLRGRVGDTRSTYFDWRDEAVRHGHAIIFAETKGAADKPETKIYVLPEIKVMEDANLAKTVFVYHSPDSLSPLVLPETYDPSEAATRMPITNVQVQERQDLALADKFFVKEARKVGKGEPGPEVGKAAEGEESKDDSPNDDPPEGWNSWQPIPELIEKDVLAGKLVGLNPLDPTDYFRRWPWSKAKKYFKPREMVFESSSHQLDGNEDDDALADDAPDDSPPPGKDTAEGHGKNQTAEGGRRAKRKDFHDAHPTQWGITVTFTTFHGNPTLLAKMLYDVEGLLPRYSQRYVATKITHSFTTKYTNEIELSR